MAAHMLFPFSELEVIKEDSQCHVRIIVGKVLWAEVEMIL